MALKQLVPIEITLVGDGSSTVFTFSVYNMYQNGTGSSIPIPSLGVLPNAISVPNPPTPVTSSSIDTSGNITITLTTAPASNAQFTFEVDLLFNSTGYTSTQSFSSTGIPAQSVAIVNSGMLFFKNGTGFIAAQPSGFNLSNQYAQSVAIVDGSGNQITSFVGTQYAEGATAATATGTVAMGKNGTTIKAVQTDSNGNLIVVGSVASAGSNAGNPVKIGGVYNTSSPTVSNGQIVDVQASSHGALYVASAPNDNFAVQATQSGTWTVQSAQSGTWAVQAANNQSAEASVSWTSSTGTNTTSVSSVVGANTVNVTINQGSTITGGVVTFEVADANSGVWYPIFGSQQGGFTASSTYTLQQSVSTSFLFDVAGFNQFRIRLSTAITGTGTVSIGLVTTSGGRATTISTVGQPTAANLNATVRTLGNAGAIFDAAQNATAPANVLAIGGVYNSSTQTITNGSLTVLQTDQAGQLKVNIAAGANPAAGSLGSSTPLSGSYTAVRIGSNLFGVSGLSVGSATPMSVAIVDGSGNQITSFGGGTQYASGTTQATPTGTVALGTNSSNVLSALKVDASGFLQTSISALGVSPIPVSQASGSNANPWYIAPDTITTVTGSWNSSTSLNTTVGTTSLGPGIYNTVTVVFNQGVITGGAVTFLAEDGAANIYQIQGTYVGSFANTTTSQYTLQSGVNQAFQFNVAGFTSFYVKLTTVITGGGVVAFNIIPSSMPNTAQAVVGQSNYTQLNTTSVLASSGGTLSAVAPSNRLHVLSEPTQLFVDTFDSTLDTTNNWSTPTTSGGGVAAATSTGVLTLGTGTTASGYSYLQSQPNFPPSVPSYLTAQFVIKLETPIQTNTYRFWGFGTTPGSPTAAAPLTNAVGFELFTDQKLYAVVYAGGTRTVIQDFSATTGNAKQPTDANYHRYSLMWRSDKQFFMIDSSDAQGTGNFVFPQVQTLPLKLQCVANTSAPSASGVITCTSIGVGDTGSNNFTLSDATYGWRGAQVDASGHLSTGNNAWGGTALGAPANFGTTPGAVIAGSVNASVFFGTTAATAATFGTTASGTGVLANASLFVGTTAATAATFGTTASGTGVLTNASLFIGTTVAVASSAGIQKVGISGNAAASLDTTINSGAAPTNALAVMHAPATAAAFALTPKYINAAAATNLKATAGNLYGMQIINLATTTTTTTSLVQYIHFYDTSNTTLSTANWKFAIPVPGNPANVIGTGAGPALSIPPGAYALANFVNGISIVVNTTSTSNTTAGASTVAGVIFIE